MTTGRRWLNSACCAALVFAAAVGTRSGLTAQGTAPEMLDPSLAVRTVRPGLTLPIGIAFLGPDDMLVLEKDTGQVKRVVNGVVDGTVLDLGVNRNSERGLLGIALHPRLSARPRRVPVLDVPQHGAAGTIRSFPTSARASTRTCSLPTATTCSRCRCSAIASIGSSGTASTLHLRSQPDHAARVSERRRARCRQGRATRPAGARQPQRRRDPVRPGRQAVHQIGDNGRRGQLQNLRRRSRRTDAGRRSVRRTRAGRRAPDRRDPAPERRRQHAARTIRSSRPAPRIGGEVGANIQKIFAYGLRNGFGMAFDPQLGRTSGSRRTATTRSAS